MKKFFSDRKTHTMDVASRRALEPEYKTNFTETVKEPANRLVENVVYPVTVYYESKENICESEAGLAEIINGLEINKKDMWSFPCCE